MYLDNSISKANINDFESAEQKKGNTMENKFYAWYENTNIVLVFGTIEERDEYVKEERIVHPECVSATYEEVRNLIEGRTPKYDDGLGCMAIDAKDYTKGTPVYGQVSK